MGARGPSSTAECGCIPRPKTSVPGQRSRSAALLAGVKSALRDLAFRWKALHAELEPTSSRVRTHMEVSSRPAPALVESHGVGVEIAGRFLVTAGDNADRSAARPPFAKLCGVDPPPVSSDRLVCAAAATGAANSASYIVTIVRMRYHQLTRDYVQRRTAEGLSDARSSAALSATSPARSTPPATPSLGLPPVRLTPCR